MVNAKQFSLNSSIFKVPKEFGGSLLKKSNPKKARPLSTKHAMHLVLRSSLAKGSQSMRSSKNVGAIDRIVRRQANRFHIRIYQIANVGNHLHLLIRVRVRQGLKAFLRAVSGLIARQVLGVQKGAGKGIKFWDYRPWSRVVDWKKGYKIARDYVIQNHLEAIGFIPYQKRSKIHRSAPA